MTEFSTLSEMLLARRASAQRLHFIDSDSDERSVSFQELVANALGYLKSLQDRGFTAGDELVIFTDNNEQFLTAFWAAMLGGLVPVPVAVGISDEHRLKLFRILRQLSNPSLFSNDRLLERISGFANEQGHTDISELLDQRAVSSDALAMSGEGVLHAPAADDLAFIQYSSGSTSDPKGVCLTHRNLCSNTQAIIDGLALNENERSLSWMPLTHDMGLIGYHVSMITANMNHAIMDTNVFVRRPLLWLQKVSELRSTVLCSPNFGYKHYLKVFERKGAGDIDLSHVRLLLNGAEPISVALCDEFLTALAPHGLKREAMLPVYGLAEATLAVAIPELGKQFSWITVDRHQLRIGEPFVQLDADNDSDDAIRLVKHGGIVSGCDVRICDDNDTALAAGFVGHIQLHGPNITKGIFGDATDEAGIYTADGWLRTGDCGAFADGELLITGRHKEIIIVNGQNYLPHDIEEVVAHIDDLDIGKVVACGARPPGSQVEQLVIFILHRKDAESFATLADQARSIVGQQIGIDVDYVLPVARIPKTTSGKIQRRMLAQAFLDGEFAEQIAAQQAVREPAMDAEGDPLVAEILAICAEFSKDKVVGPDDNLFEVGISSLTLTEIMLAVDEKHPGKVDINDLFDYPTVRELAAFLRG
jgi:acyl-CoA synthetase (AMP-forming)/AMP-acid ligase II/acyl carrier protein